MNWLLDRAADSIEAPQDPAVAGRGWRISRGANRLLGRFGSGRGPWTAGLAFLERGRWQAAAVAFEDAARKFETEVAHDHIWTAHALARQGWCYLRLGRNSDGLFLCEEAYAIAVKERPESAQLLSGFAELVEAARRNAYGSGPG